MSTNIDGKAGDTFSPSAMDRRVTIERDSGTSVNSVGEVVKNWSTVATLWAEVVPITGFEAFKMGREVSSEMVRFRMRYYPGITPKDRIGYRSTKWDILFVREVGRKRWIEITAEARA